MASLSFDTWLRLIIWLILGVEIGLHSIHPRIKSSHGFHIIGHHRRFRIAKRETELATLRRRLEARLSRLNNRREQLRSDLRSVETEIELVGSGGRMGPSRSGRASPEASRSGEPWCTSSRGRFRCS